MMNRRDLIKSLGAAGAAVRVSLAKSLIFTGGSASVAINNRAVGLNLNQPNYFGPEQPFLNIVLNNSINAAFTTRGGGGNGWLTSSYGNYTNATDANGWPTTVQSTQNQLLILRNLPKSNGGTGVYYRSGTYYCFYDGTGTVTYSFDATLSSHASGSAYGFDWMDTVTVSSPSANGIQINVTATNAAPNNIRNMAVVHSADLASWAAGGIFPPAFLSRLSNFGVLRTMDWRNTNSNTWVKNWTDEPAATDGGYGPCVPWSIIVALANQSGVSTLWVNIPMNATTSYVTSLMSYLAANLNPGIGLIVEYANEVWNGITSVFAQALANGQALWSNWATYGSTATAMSYEGYMLQQACNAAVTSFGSANVGAGKRVQVVAGAQYTNGGILDDVMTTPALVGNGGQALYGNYPIAGCCFAWYFNISPKHIPASWLNYSSSTFITNAYSEFTTGGLIPLDGESGYAQYTATVDYVTNQMATKYGSLPCFGYEGGQGETPNADFNQYFNNASAGTIARSTSYSTSSSPYRVDGNNNLYLCTVSGTTGSSAPTFNTALGGTTADGTVTWTRVQSASVSWAASWTPTVGDVVKDSNANYQMAMTVTGATGASAPTWGTTPLSPTSAGSQTTDGGATWLCIRDDSWTVLETDYSRSAQIASAYTSAMNYWKSKGASCRYFCQFNDCFPPSKFGLWGATESFLDTMSPLTSAPEKWQAIVGWSAANLKWWP